MLLLQKIAGALLEPPGLFFWGCLILLLPSSKIKKYGFPILLGTMYLFSTGLGTRLFYSYFDLSPLPEERKPEAIVILGGGTLFDQKTGRQTLHPISAMRLLQGYFLFQKEHLPCVVSGGTLWGKEPHSEGELMQEMLLRLGVPAEKIIVENRARTTWENARFVVPLLKERGITTFYLVSSQTHLPRAVFAFTHYYPESSIIPVSAHPVCDRKSLTMEDFLPSLEALSASSAFFHEWWGLLFYRFMEPAKDNTRLVP
ncbi:MAG: YdcF family protein [Atribacterota bacterium]|nr:YdcF family protein [Atribacterota bacterium]